MRWRTHWGPPIIRSIPTQHLPCLLTITSMHFITHRLVLQVQGKSIVWEFEARPCWSNILGQHAILDYAGAPSYAKWFTNQLRKCIRFAEARSRTDSAKRNALDRQTGFLQSALHPESFEVYTPVPIVVSDRPLIFSSFTPVVTHLPAYDDNRRLSGQRSQGDRHPPARNRASNRNSDRYNPLRRPRTLLPQPQRSPSSVLVSNFFEGSGPHSAEETTTSGNARRPDKKHWDCSSIYCLRGHRASAAVANLEHFNFSLSDGNLFDLLNDW